MAEPLPPMPEKLEEQAWIEVIQKMDEVYNDLLQYEVALEEKNEARENRRAQERRQKHPLERVQRERLRRRAVEAVALLERRAGGRETARNVHLVCTLREIHEDLLLRDGFVDAARVALTEVGLARDVPPLVVGPIMPESRDIPLEEPADGRRVTGADRRPLIAATPSHSHANWGAPHDPPCARSVHGALDQRAHQAAARRPRWRPWVCLASTTGFRWCRRDPRRAIRWHQLSVLVVRLVAV